MEGQNCDGKEAGDNAFKMLVSESKNYFLKSSFDCNPEMLCTGNLNVGDLNYIIRTLGFDPEQDDVQCMIQKIDEAGNGRIAFNDLLYLLHMGLAKHTRIEDLADALTLNDHDEIEKISFASLQRAADELGEPLADDELQELIDAADFDGDGELSRYDVLHILNDTSL